MKPAGGSVLDWGLLLTSVSVLAVAIMAAITVTRWWQLRPEAERKRQQQAHLRLLAVYLCELLNVQKQPPFHFTKQKFMDQYRRLAGREVARQLSEMLDEASRLGLILANDRRGGWHEWGRFRFNVELIVSSDPAAGGKPGRPPSEFVEGFLVGVMHLVGECRDQLEKKGNDVLRAQLDELWGRMAGDYWA